MTKKLTSRGNRLIPRPETRGGSLNSQMSQFSICSDTNRIAHSTVCTRYQVRSTITEYGDKAKTLPATVQFDKKTPEILKSK